MNLYKLFVMTVRCWFFSLLTVNFISLMFMNVMEQGTKSYGFCYTVTIFNIILSYLILLFMLLNYKTIEEEYTGRTNKPFHQWIWFECTNIEKYMIGLYFLVWLVPNFVHFFHMEKLGYLLGIFFILSDLYWFAVLGVMFKSSRMPTPVYV